MIDELSHTVKKMSQVGMACLFCINSLLAWFPYNSSPNASDDD